jgi:hypothetical protein
MSDGLDDLADEIDARGDGQKDPSPVGESDRDEIGGVVGL